MYDQTEEETKTERQRQRQAKSRSSKWVWWWKTMQHVINSPLGKKKDDFGYHQNQPEQKKECKASW